MLICKVSLFDALAVDGLEVIPHRDDVIARLAPLIAQLEGLLAVGVVSDIVVGYQHEGD